MITVTATIASTPIQVTAKIVNVTIVGVTGGTYNINIDGVLNQSGTSSDFSTETFNISI